jgi:hypothetical protein
LGDVAEIVGAPVAAIAIEIQLLTSCMVSAEAGAVELPVILVVFPIDKAPEYDSPKRTNLDVAVKLTVMVFRVFAPVEITHHFSTRHEVPLLRTMEFDTE